MCESHEVSIICFNVSVNMFEMLLSQHGNLSTRCFLALSKSSCGSWGPLGKFFAGALVPCRAAEHSRWKCVFEFGRHTKWHGRFPEVSKRKASDTCVLVRRVCGNSVNPLAQIFRWCCLPVVYWNSCKWTWVLAVGISASGHVPIFCCTYWDWCFLLPPTYFPICYKIMRPYFTRLVAEPSPDYSFHKNASSGDFVSFLVAFIWKTYLNNRLKSSGELS